MLYTNQEIEKAENEAGVQSWSFVRFFTGEETMPEFDCPLEDLGWVMRARQEQAEIEEKIMALTQRKREIDLYIESKRAGRRPPSVTPAPFLAAFRAAQEKRNADR